MGERGMGLKGCFDRDDAAGISSCLPRRSLDESYRDQASGAALAKERK
jgi:hypothetical protein